MATVKLYQGSSFFVKVDRVNGENLYKMFGVSNALTERFFNLVIHSQAGTFLSDESAY